MIYLDNSATTMVDTTVMDSYKQVSERYFANPSSIHMMGAETELLQTKARKQAADLLGILQEEVIFTSGGTEGDNMAIKGIAFEHQSRGKHIITTQIEHAAVYETCKSLENYGFDITYLPVDQQGLVRVEDIENAIRSDTILISIMHVNNEIGTIQPIREIGAIAKQYPKLYFHVDGVQALGKLPLNLNNSGIDLYTMSGHKIHGLKGTGMLYIKQGTRLFPLFHGGGQEGLYRSGTENVAGNVSFVRALRLITEKRNMEATTLKACRDYLFHGLQKIEGVYVNSPENGVSHIVNASVPGLKPEVIINKLAEEGVIISTQSACSSKQSDKSRVLLACGFSEDRIISGLRFSLTYGNTKDEMDTCLQIFRTTIQNLKAVMG